MSIVRSREDELDRLEKAHSALSDIALSSAYSSHHDTLVNDIINFDEFIEVYEKISKWSTEFRKRVDDIEYQ